VECFHRISLEATISPINLDSISFEQKIAEEDDADSVLLDVRTPMENKEARIPNSKLVDISSPSFVNEIESTGQIKKLLCLLSEAGIEVIMQVWLC
jgi:rhodanese-related sulfurtransferase